MIAVTVLYRNTDALKFNMDYYLNTHMPLVGKLLGTALQGVQVQHGLSGAAPGSKPEFLVITQLKFSSVESSRARSVRMPPPSWAMCRISAARRRWSRSATSVWAEVARRVQVRHWFSGGIVLLAVAGAYVLGGHLHTAPPSDTVARPQIRRSDDSAAARSGQPQGEQNASTNAAPVAAVTTDSGFGFAAVEDLARQRSRQAVCAGSSKLPPAIAHLTYDQYQSIRFRHADALWRNESLFEVQFFHRGFNFDRRVAISEVVDGAAHPIPYNPLWFDFGKVVRQPGKLPRDLGYAGFRIHYPLHTPNYRDELIVSSAPLSSGCWGATRTMGATARGLAIDTASKDGEEFPWFTDFWLVRPTDPQQRTLTIYALLDSDSITGAYQFKVQPGAMTQVQVTSTLYPRRSIQKLGVAPLTSMFLFGADPSGHRFDDLRPQVHDSDGFMAQTGSGEWLWRPLSNPHELRINRFMDQRPQGFGLIQRDRDSRTTRIRWRASSAGPATGSSRWATGARAGRSWWRFPRTRRFTTTSRSSGCPSNTSAQARS